MKTLAVTILTAIICVPSGFAQPNPPPAEARHCSVKEGNGELPYPDALKGSGIQGTILLQAVIGVDGCAGSVKVVQKLDPELDKLAEQAVNSWKFKPATKDGRPVKVMVQIAVKFKDPGK